MDYSFACIYKLESLLGLDSHLTPVTSSSSFLTGVAWVKNVA